ncbi:glycosyltransferase family 4 protein [Leptospira congkakensis]|uniref:Glycosyltransferase family 4 protein n=1 Tax=Leptospira congkakensis TaxID=2484932 RepID=A0A4Z1A1L1_9LEPT|nr:glycosyltransferase family 4 protein [Leptospira congkakensis]TGL87625.1 glycosyltransferase family 4 protein [Leptospira congkakensis]TGL89760.1 glycosyltransferase family 4 protein [Leptospira congkakensis]TGL95775.1 glycosyltransferase family 4 protein [Leptospira congkakensis]
MVSFLTIIIAILAILSLILHSFYVYSRFGVKDVPNERSLHDVVTKKSGGMFFIPIFLLASLGLLFYPNHLLPLPESPSSRIDIYLLLAGVLLFCILGFIDDLYHLSPKLRLFLELSLVAVFLYWVNPEITFFGMFTLPKLALVFGLTVFLVFAVNLVNFMDGMDWYLVTTIFLSYFSLAFIFPNFYSVGNYGYSFYLILFVSMFGFIFYNFPKAKLFMGDSGSLALGFFVLALPLFVGKWMEPKQEVWDVTYYFYLFPYFWLDGIFILIKRFFQKKHLFSAHREHLYQRITETKLGKIGSLAIFFTLNLILVCLHFVFKTYGVPNNFILILLFLFSAISYGILWIFVPRKNLA